MANKPKRERVWAEIRKREAPAKGTLILRATMLHVSNSHRDIEIDAGKSLYHLAEAIVTAFGFYFDHAFGFYSGKTERTLMDALPKYELFADMGEPTEGALGVKRTKITMAFPRQGHVMTFLFDYGDSWMFRLELIGVGEQVAKRRYPRVVVSEGKAPKQYPPEGERL